MRKESHSRERVPMNLQLFAASGDGAGAEGGNGDGAEGENGGTSGEERGEADPPSFDDILKDGHQAEFDRRMQKGIETALAKAQEKWKVLTDDKLSEAEKLAKMTKEEKALYLQQKHEKALAAREADITRRELMAEEFANAGLAEVLNYTDAESCNKSMVAVEKAFQEAVQAAVEEKLKGGTPPKKAPTGGDDDLAKQVENLMMGSI